MQIKMFASPGRVELFKEKPQIVIFNVTQLVAEQLREDNINWLTSYNL